MMRRGGGDRLYLFGEKDCFNGRIVLEATNVYFI
jgi:hypothetical protein